MHTGLSNVSLALQQVPINPLPSATARKPSSFAADCSGKAQEVFEHLSELRGPQPRDRVPTAAARKPVGIAARVRADRDVVEHARVRILLGGQ